MTKLQNIYMVKKAKVNHVGMVPIERKKGQVAKKEIRVLSCGGGVTFSYQSGTPSIGDISAVLDSLKNMVQMANVKTISFHRTSSSAMLVEDIISLALEIKRLIAEERVNGFVVVQGTDTIEETAFLLNLLIHDPAPIAITGGVRIPDFESPDGPANLLSALQVVSSDNCRDIGTVVVFNEVIFPGDLVRNTHTHIPQAFGAECGSLGFVVEGVPNLRLKPIRRKVPYLHITTNKVQPVPIYSVPMGDDGRILGAIRKLGYRGLVLEALGGGHVPTGLVEKLEALAREIPVILASRVEFGDMLTSTYSGYPGSETSLLKRGLISAGMLDGRKARILLILLLMSGCSREEIVDSFRIFSRAYLHG